MNDIKCPNCNSKISFLNFLKAPTPNHMKCNHCKSKLKLAEHGNIITLSGFMIGILVGIILGILDLSYTQYILILISLLLFFETTLFLFIRSKNINLIEK